MKHALSRIDRNTLTATQIAKSIDVLTAILWDAVIMLMLMEIYLSVTLTTTTKIGERNYVMKYCPVVKQ